MKILNPNEFKQQNPNAYLDDYLAYLENAQKEAEDTLENAKVLSLDKSIIENIQSQVEDIFQMAMIVEDYMGQIILKSIDTLSLEELQSYFDFEEENKQAEEKKSELENKKANLRARLDEIEKQIANNLYANGRVKEFYEAQDTNEFFKENQDPRMYIENLLHTSSKDSLFEGMIDELKKQLIVALETECHIQNIELTEEKRNEIISNIIELFRKCKNIIKYTPEAKEQLSKVVLSDSGIKQLLPEEFAEDTSINLITDLMNLKKIVTTFYSNLPSSLQDRLVKERLQGETYKTLLKTYRAFTNGEELPSDDLSNEEKQEKREIEGQLESIKYEIVSLNADKDSQQKFLRNAEAMRSVIREEIIRTLNGKVSAKDIAAIINEAETKAENLRSELVNASELLSFKTSDLETAEKILLDSEYHDFFQTVENNNVRRLYKAFGVNVTDEVIEPALEEEQNREVQIRILTDLQKKLQEIEDEIKRIKEKANFITKLLPSYKERLNSLTTKYQEEVNRVFNELKEKNLFQVFTPIISADSTVGHVITTYPEEKKNPSDFSELRGIKQTFWSMPTGIDENTKKRFLSENEQYDNWEEFYQDLLTQQSELVKKLFNFTKEEDGHYVFWASEADREKLKHIQSVIVELLLSIYEERRAFRENLETSSSELDEEKVAMLERFLGKGSNLSRENLINYIDRTKAQIKELKNLLASNATQCKKLGIEIPEDVKDVKDTTEEETKELEAKIKGLNLDGITTLEQAIEYRNLLLGLEEYTVPSSEVKEYYKKHK